MVGAWRAALSSVHRPDRLELVRKAARVRRRGEERQVDQAVDALGREDLADALFGGGLRQIDLVHAGLLACRVRGFDVDGDDAIDAIVFFRRPSRFVPKKEAAPGHRDGAERRRRPRAWFCGSACERPPGAWSWGATGHAGLGT